MSAPRARPESRPGPRRPPRRAEPAREWAIAGADRVAAGRVRCPSHPRHRALRRGRVLHRDARPRSGRPADCSRRSSGPFRPEGGSPAVDPALRRSGRDHPDDHPGRLHDPAGTRNTAASADLDDSAGPGRGGRRGGGTIGDPRQRVLDAVRGAGSEEHGAQPSPGRGPSRDPAAPLVHAGPSAGDRRAQRERERDLAPGRSRAANRRASQISTIIPRRPDSDSYRNIGWKCWPRVAVGSEPGGHG